MSRIAHIPPPPPIDTQVRALPLQRQGSACVPSSDVRQTTRHAWSRALLCVHVCSLIRSAVGDDSPTVVISVRSASAAKTCAATTSPTPHLSANTVEVTTEAAVAMVEGHGDASP